MVNLSLRAPPVLESARPRMTKLDHQNINERKGSLDATLGRRGTLTISRLRV
jgi:hypothetical protein